MNAAPAATTPAQYLAALPEDRRAALTKLHRAIRRAAPKLTPHLAHGMIGYGRFHYKYASGREGDMAIIALASQKQYISLYILCVDKDDRYLAEKNKDRLGKVSVGKSCIRFKKLEDLNLGVAMTLVKKAAGLRGKDGGPCKL